MEPVRLIPASKEHLDFLVDCQLSLASETEDLKLDSEKLRQGVAAILSDPQRGIYYVAFTTDPENPMACMLTTFEWSDWRNSWYWWIQSLFVQKDHRGKSVFKNMLRLLKEKMNDHDKSPACGIRLYVDKSNHSASQVYRQLGFTSEHYNMYEWLQE